MDIVRRQYQEIRIKVDNWKGYELVEMIVLFPLGNVVVVRFDNFIESQLIYDPFCER